MKLKPCPFCGSEAAISRKPLKTNGGWCDAVYVQCTACDARGRIILYDAETHQSDSEYTEAVEAWNKREPIDKIIEKLEDKMNIAIDERNRGSVFKRMHEGKADAYCMSIRVIKEESCSEN